MPLVIPTLDDRDYRRLRDESLARIQVHNPEWRNFNESDPGVTLLELFAFMAESVLYRANQMPERNRLKFLSLLGVRLHPATAAEGLVVFSSQIVPARTVTLPADVEVRAGQVPFRTGAALDVLPVEGLVVYKRPAAPDARLVEHYRQLYASFTGGTAPTALKLYQTTLFSERATEPIDLASDAVDGSLWMALMVRSADRGDGSPKALARAQALAREQLVGKTLSLALVPAPAASGAHLGAGDVAPAQGLAELQIQIPSLPPDRKLPERADRNAQYRTLVSATVPSRPTVVEVPLPGTVEELSLWDNLDPLEAGARDFPPALSDAEQALRVVTWLRIVAPGASSVPVAWAGLNAAAVSQLARVVGEQLPAGSGEPDQAAVLSQHPVLPGSVTVWLTAGGRTKRWEEIDDLGAAGAEVQVTDPRQPPGSPPPRPVPSQRFRLDAEAGQLRFGDGYHGARPPAGSSLRADYAICQGAKGNVGPDSVDSGPALPPGIKVRNPIATWGGADAEPVGSGERQIPRYLQHRDRAVSATDFETLALRTPGVAVGRVDVLPAFHPALSPNEPGDAPGAVTVMVIPAGNPDAPPAGDPDPFLRAVACWLAPRRLVTTELFVRRPIYRPVWVSLGVELVAGMGQVEVREAVKLAVQRFLLPLPASGVEVLDDQLSLFASPQYSQDRKGWPLRKPVLDLELAAVAARVPGVALVRQVRLAPGGGAEAPRVEMAGLELPRLAGVAITVGDAPAIDDLRGSAPAPAPSAFVPVPVVPEEC